jgi:hypothetical protein
MLLKIWCNQTLEKALGGSIVAIGGGSGAVISLLATDGGSARRQ